MPSSSASGQEVRFAKLSRLYRGSAFLFFNLLVLFLTVNILLWVLFRVPGLLTSSQAAPSPQTRYERGKLAAVYPQYTDPEREALLKETWSRPLVYEDFTLYRERPFRGKFVNVDPVGFRHSREQGPWPPSAAHLNVFVFGGSTAFGYGVADWETVPSYLQECLRRHLPGRRVCVYNFAAGYFYSSQERILLEKLLISGGGKPDLAVFINGINECGALGRKPVFRERFQDLIEGGGLDGHKKAVPLIAVEWTRFPLGRAANALNRVLNRPPVDPAASLSAYHEEEAARIIPNYLGNKAVIEAVCEKFGVQLIFVWQPTPHYNYDTQYHLFMTDGQIKKTKRAWVETYTRMKKALERGGLGRNFIWCGDLQANERECLYVDQLHYTAKFSSKIADFIGAACRQRGLISSGRSIAAPLIFEPGWAPFP